MIVKQYRLALVALLTLSLGEIAGAQALEFDVGPGGVYVGPYRHRGYYHDRDRYYGSYNRYRGDSCEMWQHECARSYGGGYMYDRCMSRPAAVMACR